jgi:hypothetical protein
MRSVFQRFVNQREARVSVSVPRMRNESPKEVVPRSIHAPSGSGVVHLAYDMKNPPQRPVQREGEHWTRFVCISDTHSEDFIVPEGDILLHAGDLTSFGRVVELQTTMSWLCQLPHPVKMCLVVLSISLISLP